MQLPSFAIRILSKLVLIISVIMSGAIGYMTIERWSFLDAVFMSVITITTIGYGEVKPLSTPGRIFTILYVFVGAGLALYLWSEMAEIIFSVNPTAAFEKRRMKKRIKDLENHQIVCGFGRTGQEVAAQFAGRNTAFVVIDIDQSLVSKAEQLGYNVLHADATSDEALLAAGITRAAGVVCALADDAANTFIVLSARGLSDSVQIVCRAADVASEKKMLRAGANKVISPYVICGRRMANASTRPLLTEFLDVVVNAQEYDWHMERFQIERASALSGKTLKEANVRELSGAMVLAVGKGFDLIPNPDPSFRLSPGDELIVLGSREQLGDFRHLLVPTLSVLPLEVHK